MTLVISPSPLALMKTETCSFQLYKPLVNPRTCIEIAMNTAVSNNAVKMNPVTTHGSMFKIEAQLFRGPSVMRSSLAIGGRSWVNVVTHNKPKITVALMELR